MENQRLETIDSGRESRQPNAKKHVKRAVAALATISSLWALHVRPADGRPTGVEVAGVEAASSESSHIKDMMLEVKAFKDARVRADNVRRLNEAIWNIAVWNNALAASRIPYDPELWNRLHQCEQGDSWYASGYNPADPAHQLFQGGLGMSTESWAMAVHDAATRGVTLPSTALKATVDQQMQGAQVFWEDEGWGWSCHV